MTDPAPILVIGGNGFIGAEICRVAALAGHPVISLSRSGPPVHLPPNFPPVTWAKGDVFQPEGWRHHLVGCAAVIHSLGVIAEDQAHGRTFERMNGDTAIAAATEAQAAGVPKFVFISAALNPPWVGPGYLQGKRKAEQFLAGLAMGSAILRPGPVIGRRRPWTVVLGALMGLAVPIPLVGAGLSRIRPLSVEVVARAAYRAAVDEALVGILDVDRIGRIGA